LSLHKLQGFEKSFNRDIQYIDRLHVQKRSDLFGRPVFYPANHSNLKSSDWLEKSWPSKKAILFSDM